MMVRETRRVKTASSPLSQRGRIKMHRVMEADGVRTHQLITQELLVQHQLTLV